MVKWVYERMITRQDGSTHFILTEKKHAHLLDDYKHYNWYVKNIENILYAYTNKTINGVRKSIALHRLIMGLDFGDDRVVDHLNHNGLDNRGCNLEIKTVSQNAMNRKIPVNSKSGVSGVRFREDRQKWIARIMINGNEITLGSFDTIEEAAQVRKDAEVKYFGDNSYDACTSRSQ